MLPEEYPESWMDRNLGLVLRLGVFIIVIIILLISTGYIKQIMVYINPDLKNCASGTCKESCIKDVEIQKQGVKCIDSDKVCCIPKEYVTSPECINKTLGYGCGKAMLCDENNICISRCEYCSKHPTDAECTISKTVGKNVNIFDGTFGCKCTEMECISFDSSKLGTCIQDNNFCPSDSLNAVDGNCCSSPYR